MSRRRKSVPRIIFLTIAEGLAEFFTFKWLGDLFD